MKIDNDKTVCIGTTSASFQFLKIKLGTLEILTIYYVLRHRIPHRYFLQIAVTAMRKNPVYAIYYNNWARLFILGIIPAAMLIYLNYKVSIIIININIYIFSICVNKYWTLIITFWNNLVKGAGRWRLEMLLRTYFYWKGLLKSYRKLLYIGKKPQKLCTLET